MIRRPPRSTQSRSSAASDVYKRQRLRRRHLLAPSCVMLRDRAAPDAPVLSFISRFNQILGKSVAFAAKDALRRERAQARERDLPQGAPGTWLHLGNEHYAAQRLAQAEACYREALRLSPELADACNNLGLVLRTTGRYAEA